MNDISEYATRADYLLEDFEVQIQSQWQREERVKRFKEEEEEEAEIDLDLEADTHTSIRTGMGEVNMETNSAVDAATVESDGAEAVGEERNSQSVGAGSGSAQEKMNAEHERVEL